MSIFISPVCEVVGADPAAVIGVDRIIPAAVIPPSTSRRVDRKDAVSFEPEGVVIDPVPFPKGRPQWQAGKSEPALDGPDLSEAGRGG
ncbi:hypothetical protein [Novosphingobium gossypii]|uniref:hypothetical protein n=1 Tax=Novosphingobium gossypii TaxID=1604774 RepID=UPI003D1903F7